MSETSTENHLEDPESLGEHTPMSEVYILNFLKVSHMI